MSKDVKIVYRCKKHMMETNSICGAHTIQSVKMCPLHWTVTQVVVQRNNVHKTERVRIWMSSQLKMFSFSGLTHQHGTACAPGGCCKTGTEFHRLHTCRFLERNVQFLSEHRNVLITEPHIRALHTANKCRSASGIQEKGFYLKVKKPARFESHANGIKMGMSEVSHDLQKQKNRLYMEHEMSDIKWKWKR